MITTEIQVFNDEYSQLVVYVDNEEHGWTFIPHNASRMVIHAKAYSILADAAARLSDRIAGDMS